MLTVFVKYHGTAYFRVETEDDRQKVEEAYKRAFEEVAKFLAPSAVAVVVDHNSTTSTY